MAVEDCFFFFPLSVPAASFQLLLVGCPLNGSWHMWPKCKSDSDFPFKWAPRGICTRPPLWPCGPFFIHSERRSGTRAPASSVAKWRAQCPSPLIKVLLRRIWTQFAHKVAPGFSHHAQAVIFKSPRISGFLGEKSRMINKQSHLRANGALVTALHSRWGAKCVFFSSLSLLTADAPKRVWQLSSCSPPPAPPLSPFLHSSRSISPSITPDCIGQMPLLAPYHQVWWRQPKTILLCPCTVAPPLPSLLPFPFCLYFTWLIFLLLLFRWQYRGSRLRAASRVLCSAPLWAKQRTLHPARSWGATAELKKLGKKVQIMLPFYVTIFIRE